MREVDFSSAGVGLLADYTDLTDSALRRVKEPEWGLYIAESLTILSRALGAGHKPRSVLTSQKWLPALAETLAPFPQSTELPVIVGEDDQLEGLTGFHVHRGTLASMYRPALPALAEILIPATRIVVLEDIVDHTNVGAVFRSVAAMGADAIVVSERCADPLYRRSIRVSMGTVFQVPWTRAAWPEIEATLSGQKIPLVGLALTPDAEDFDQWIESAPERVALALGSEGPGLSNRALRACEAKVQIPMSHGVDSLNVAAASAVALHALRRRRS